MCDKRYHGNENIINEKTVLGRLEHVWQLLKCKDSTYIIMTVFEASIKWKMEINKNIIYYRLINVYNANGFFLLMCTKRDIIILKELLLIYWPK